MKQVILSAAVVVTTLLTTAVAVEAHVRDSHTADIVEMEIDPTVKRNYHGGSIEVDYRRRSVRLSVQVGPACPAGSFCAQFIRLETIELPIVSMKSSCGSRIVVAREDLRPVDGALHEITVEDHRARLCDDYRPFVTEVTEVIETLGRGTGPSRIENYFGAGALKQNFQVRPMTGFMDSGR